MKTRLRAVCSNSSKCSRQPRPPLSSSVQHEDSHPTNIAPPAPPLKPSTNPVYDDELSADDAQEADNMMDESLRFIRVK